jgi:hypothetical protein
MDILSEQSGGELEKCAAKVAAATYRNEMQNLILPNVGFHFRGRTTCLAQFESFSISEMGKKIQIVAPNLWQLLGILLDADERRHVETFDGMDVDEEVDDAGGNDEGSEESENEDDIEDESDKRDSESEMEESAPRKRRYRKQNRKRRNATLFFILS